VPEPLSKDGVLLAECLLRYADEGVPGLCAVLTAHPARARRLLRRVLLLADLGLLPDPPGS
jgi:hypothetical protein